MGKGGSQRPRFEPVPLRERIGQTYDELITAGVRPFTHVPWEMFVGDDGPDTWVLCAFGCQRAYQLREAKWVLDLPGEFAAPFAIPGDGTWYCAYFPECGQDAVLRAWSWNDLLAQGWQGPLVPVRGVRYPLYPARG
jgi:hypothetical protein